MLVPAKTNRDTTEAILLLGEFFKGDAEKITNWLMIPNPMLGEARPIDLIRQDRGHKVLAFVKAMKSENNWEAHCPSCNSMKKLLDAKDHQIESYIKAIKDNIGPWMSAALSDPSVCPEMKQDIEKLFATLPQESWNL